MARWYAQEKAKRMLAEDTGPNGARWAGLRLTSERGFLCYRSSAARRLTTADISQAMLWGCRVSDGASPSKLWERRQTFKGLGVEGEDEGVERAWRSSTLTLRY